VATEGKTVIVPNLPRLEFEPAARDVDFRRDFVVEDFDRLSPVIARLLLVKNERP
jgi:hypothetical protein